MSAGELVDVLVMVMVVVVGTQRVREAHQPAQGASELGVRGMLEDPTVHGRPGCGAAEVKTQREAVWLNMQSERVGGEMGGGGSERGRRKGGEGREGNPGRRPSSAATAGCDVRGNRSGSRGGGDRGDGRRSEVFHVYGSSRDVKSTLLFLSC